MSKPKRSLAQLEMHEDFVRRHIGPDDESLEKMLATLGLSSLDELVSKTVPASILSKRPLDLAPPGGNGRPAPTFATCAIEIRYSPQ